ncbi:glucokinase [beta proteobacterium AAP121]|nr:glucokinase [beta proteobacterium AAP65]KPF99774.1 glucokinase [beta proteobacterium AAP121]
MAAGPPRPWLVADIGGTNARFGWLAEGADRISHVATLPAAGHPGPADAATSYLAGVAQALGGAYRPPRAAAFAVATAVGTDRIAFTNSGWAFSCREAQAALGLEALLVLNDFEALALSLPRLQAQQLLPWPGAPVRTALPGRNALAVIGPGTGLGVAGLVPAPGGGWVAVPGEGGHASLSAADEFDAALLAAVRREHPHVSAERLLSGIGLPVLHAAVAAVMGQGQDQPAATLAAEQIVERGLNGSCAVCSRTLDAFCALLGSFAGNVALVMGARGGVYIGGGIVPRLGERFFQSPFRQRFEAKGRFQAYLQAIPTLLITDTLAALNGGVQALTQHRA